MRATALVLLGGLASGCGAMTRYEPRVVARGEIVLRYRGGFEMYAGGRQVARSLRWKGLSGYVRCVPEAAERADRAESDGSAAIALSALGATFGALALGGVVGFGADGGQHAAEWLGGGVGMAVLGTVMSGLGRLYKNRANGQAVDAMNYYNDAVGSLGASCDHLRYPAPVAPWGPPPLGPGTAAPEGRLSPSSPPLEPPSPAPLEPPSLAPLEPPPTPGP